MSRHLAIVISDRNNIAARDALYLDCDLIAVAPADLDKIPAMRPTVLLVFHTLPISGEFLERCTTLKLLMRMAVGYDNIDTKRAGELGIAVSNVPAYGTEEVADSAITHILNLYRQTFQIEAWTHRNEPLADAPHIADVVPNMIRIRGQKLGLVGLGAIGYAVAQRAKVFGFEVSFFDPYLPDGFEKDKGIHRHMELDEILRDSDIISFHCKQTDENKHMLNARTIALMKKGARIVNVARGGLIDEPALVAALKSGHISCAALDVQETEPYIRKDSPFCDVPNVYCLPHVAWFSQQGLADIWSTAVGEIKRALCPGVTPDGLKTCINRDVLVLDSKRWI